MQSNTTFRSTLIRFLFAFLALGILAGCATTQVASTWKDPADNGPPIRKLIVFVAGTDPSIRRLAEDEAVRSLPKGTVGVASYTQFEKAEFDEHKMRSKLQREGFDGALVSRLVSVDKSQTYVPPQTQFVQPPPVLMQSIDSPQRSFFWYYPYAYTYTTPGYQTETTRIIVETLLYRLPDGKPVWSAVTESVNPDSKLSLMRELNRIVGKELNKEGLIRAQ